MIKVEKKKCCGCSACANACPKNAISMEPDFEGFLYPEIHKDKCVECGLCNKVCPVENKPEGGSGVPKSVVLRTKNRETLRQSTSGGFVSPLLTWVMEQGGVICAASYDEDFKVVHSFVENFSDLPAQLQRIRGSKYVQSELGNSYVRIRQLLDDGTLVCFVGTTCQVAGLRSFLGRDYENLIGVDLVCHGTPSPKLWNSYLDYQKGKYRSEIQEISFRNKTYGYHSGTMRIRFKNGKEYYGSARVDYMLKSFFSEISSRPICYQCPFKELNRCSDFTIYDCWHAADLIPGLVDDDGGYTNVIVQSKKGQDVLSQIGSSYEIYPSDTKKAVALDGSMVLCSAKPHPRRGDFYKEMGQMTIAKHVQKYIPITWMDHLIEKSKICFYRLGIYRWMKCVITWRR